MYRLKANGYQSALDARLHADVLFRQGGPDAGAGVDGGPFQLITSGEGPARRLDAGSETFLDTVVSGPAIPAACGDTLLYRVTVLSGTTNFYDLELSLDIP